MYHISRDGLPNVCKAYPGNCPLAAASEHYENKMEAILAAEELLSQETDFLSSQKKHSLYHVGPKGNVEKCSKGESDCDVKPYGIYSNVHSFDESVTLGAAKAFRDIQGEAPTPSPTPPKAPPATDPITSKADKLRGDIYDSYRKKGYTEEEIQRHKDSCGHWTPPRFSRPTRGWPC